MPCPGESHSIVQEPTSTFKESKPTHSCVTKAMVLCRCGDDVVAGRPAFAHDRDDFPTKTPIKHVVVIFQENVSFDHYFATYPHATNPGGEPQFHAKDDTPRVNNLLAGGLLDQNPNSVQPFRLDRSQAVTCDQDHNYADEQAAFNLGLMDKFPESGRGFGRFRCADCGKGTGLVMGYYDGNTVTALWNYAQHFAMSDNSYNTTFGPSTPGAVNLISGDTSGATLVPLAADGVTPGNPKGNIAGGLNSGAVIGDPRPGFDNCLHDSGGRNREEDSDHNVRDQRGRPAQQEEHHLGMVPGRIRSDRQELRMERPLAVRFHNQPCFSRRNERLHSASRAVSILQVDGEPQSPTAKRTPKQIGQTDQANHQYDLQDFWDGAVRRPAASGEFLKAKGAQDGHAGYSDPLDEQTFVVERDQRAAANRRLERNSRDHRVRRLRRLVRSRDGCRREPVRRFRRQPDGPGDLRSHTEETGTPGPLRVRAATAAPGDFAVGEAELRRSSFDGSGSMLRFIEDNWGLGRIGGRFV